ncbi:MAG TPA: hypothetical protein VML50_02575 [Anaeromyxobacter sp.]|nr:hypothetical protein [Anaeromyxobacter sp.]
MPPSGDPAPDAASTAATPSPRALTRARAVTAGILAVGWSVAVAVYLAAAPAAQNDLVDEWEGSRRYQREVEVIGGKAVLFASEADRWLASLWQGRNLAYTIAVLAALAALGHHLLAGRSRDVTPPAAGSGP